MTLTGGTPAATFTFAATGDMPITWTVTVGALPPGMTVASSGLYSGTPTAAGTFTFTVQAANAAGTATLAVQQVVNAPPPDTHLLLTSNRLVPFNAAFPVALPPIALTGIVAGETLVGIDRRPMNGMLYGLGINSTTSTGTLYGINPSTGVATPLAPSLIALVDASSAVVSFAAARWGIDFNPVADRLRVTNNTGLNFRVNPNTGLPVDGAPASPGANPDGPFNGAAVGVDEVAYTNNAMNQTVTTLYAVDSVADSLFLVNPPNAGTLTLVAALTMPVDAVVGFDVAPGVNVASNNGPVTSGSGLALVRLAGASTVSLITINLVNGVVSNVTDLGTANVVGLAVQRPIDLPMVALSDAPAFVRFFRNSPTTTTATPITNLASNEVLVGIDYRPATGQLYGLGVNGNTTSGTLYLLDPATGAATVVGSPGSITPLPAAAGGYGFDFNPVPDRIRVVSGTGLNMRLNPNTGAVAAIDTSLNSGAMSASGAAYTNSVGGATLTSLYALDATTHALYLQNPPNGGVLTAIGTVMLGTNPLNFTALGGFDIPPPAAGPAYAVLTVGGMSSLYSIDLTTGAATLVGAVATGTLAITGLAAGRTDL